MEINKKLENKTITNVENSQKVREKIEIIPQKTKINKKYGQNTRAMKMTDYFSRKEKACKRKIIEIGGGEEIIEI